VYHRLTAGEGHTQATIAIAWANAIHIRAVRIEVTNVDQVARGVLQISCQTFLIKVTSTNTHFVVVTVHSL
jgi:hypothetical protein